jgi:hypothetical protein
MKIDKVSSRRTSELILKSSPMYVRAGATIVEDTGEMKVYNETTVITDHFLLLGQFLGFSGSLGPSHVTCAVG